MIYFDNSATSGHKPSNVLDNTINVIKYLSTNAGRSGHRLSKTASDIIFNARKKISNFFNNQSVEKIIFTKNCTEALNMAIYGSISQGDNVITSVFEHNSVLRPLFTLRDKGVITLTIISPKNNQFINVEDIKNAFTPKTKVVIINHISNVNGSINDIDSIGEFLKDKDTTFIVDGAQSGGHLKIDMQKSNVDILCLAGHKGLYAIQGSGILVLNKNIDINSFMQGGTGTETFNTTQPDCYPEKLEAGTLNLPSICSLYEGVCYVENNLDYISTSLMNLTKFLIENLQKLQNITIYSKPNIAGIVAFSMKNINSIELAEILSTKYDIASRGGFHCAPLMHKFLKTEESGLLRVSLSPANTINELVLLLSALKQLI